MFVLEDVACVCAAPAIASERVAIRAAGAPVLNAVKGTACYAHMSGGELSLFKRDITAARRDLVALCEFAQSRTFRLFLSVIRCQPCGCCERARRRNECKQETERAITSRQACSVHPRGGRTRESGLLGFHTTALGQFHFVRQGSVAGHMRCVSPGGAAQNFSAPSLAANSTAAATFSSSLVEPMPRAPLPPPLPPHTARVRLTHSSCRSAPR
jgi:hypothetical protein